MADDDIVFPPLSQPTPPQQQQPQHLLQQQQHHHQQNQHQPQHQQQLNYQVKTPVWQTRAFLDWTKSVLIAELVDPGDAVCELCCKQGISLGKWQSAAVGQLCCIDKDAALLEDATARWQLRNQPFPASFLQHALQTDPLPENPIHNVVACFSGMKGCFESVATCRRFLGNAVGQLKPGGFFFGIVPDSSSIWYRAQKTQSETLRRVQGELYTIDLLHSAEGFTNFGSKFRLRLEDGSETVDFLVHFPTLLQEAKRVGLRWLEITNLAEFYEDHKHNHSEKLRTCGVLNKKIVKLLTPQLEVIGLYTTFVFQKPENPLD